MRIVIYFGESLYDDSRFAHAMSKPRLLSKPGVCLPGMSSRDFLKTKYEQHRRSGSVCDIRCVCAPAMQSINRLWRKPLRILLIAHAIHSSNRELSEHSEACKKVPSSRDK
jgi:hypothetical protein